MSEQPDVSVRGLGTSVVTYRFGGREYPLKVVARCRVCNHPMRFDIERLVVAGRIYKKIAEEMAGHGEEYAVLPRNIADHFYNGHMPLELANTRALVETRARQVGKDVDEGIEQLVDGITLLSTVVTKTFEAIAEGEIKPGVRDGVQAAKMLADLGAYDGSSVDQQAFVQAFIVYHETVEQLMDPEEFKRFGRMLEDNPVLKALAARYDGEPETVSGEVTERTDQTRGEV